jgi:hypothetical protein
MRSLPGSTRVKARAAGLHPGCRHAGLIGALFLSFVAGSAGAGASDGRSNDLSSSPRPKVGHQTVGSGPRFLTEIEKRKLAEASTPAARAPEAGRAAEAPDDLIAVPGFSRISLSANAKSTGFTTFLPMADFVIRSLDATKLAQRPAAGGAVNPEPVPIHAGKNLTREALGKPSFEPGDADRRKLERARAQKGEQGQ